MPKRWNGMLTTNTVATDNSKDAGSLCLWKNQYFHILISGEGVLRGSNEMRIMFVGRKILIMWNTPTWLCEDCTFTKTITFDLLYFINKYPPVKNNNFTQSKRKIAFLLKNVNMESNCFNFCKQEQEIDHNYIGLNKINPPPHFNSLSLKLN